MSQTEDYNSKEVIKQQETTNTEETKTLFGYECPWKLTKMRDEKTNDSPDGL